MNVNLVIDCLAYFSLGYFIGCAIAKLIAFAFRL